MALEREWLLRMEERFLLEEDQKEEKDCLYHQNSV